MTVAIALKCSDGVLVASDSMASQARIASSADKVFTLQSQPIIWTASGSLFVIEEVATQLAEVEQGIASNADAEAAFAAPDLPAVRSTLYTHITETMKGCYSGALPYGLQQLENGRHPFFTDFLLAGYAKETPFLLEIASDGEMNWHTDEGFYAIGSGGDFASVAQALMRHYLDSGPLPLQYGMQLAYRTIETACEVSSMHVRTPVQIAVADDSGARILKKEEMDRVASGVAGWKQIERDALWGNIPSAGTSDLDSPPSFDDAQAEAVKASTVIPAQDTGSKDRIPK
jgi:20S proteasome alpha/beta subunit